MKTKTELDHKFEYSDSPDFGKEMIIYWVSGFMLGGFIATVIIMGVMSIIDQL